MAATVFRLAGEHAGTAHRLTLVEDLAAALDDLEGVFAAAAHATLPPPPPAGLDPAPAANSSRTAGPDPGRDRAGEDGAGAMGSPEDGGLDMRRLVAWVRDNVALLLERKVPQTGGAPYWCRSWWSHPEAIARFEAARRCWAEAVSSDSGSAMVIYFEHLDHQLGVLCGEAGPFGACVGGTHRTGGSTTALGQDEPDKAYFLDFEQARDGWDSVSHETAGL